MRSLPEGWQSGSRRIVLYDLDVVDAQLHDGKQIPTRINGLRVRMPLTITNSDRRYLQPEPAAGTTPVPSLEPRASARDETPALSTRSGQYRRD